MKKNLLLLAVLFLIVALAVPSWAQVMIRTQAEPAGGPYTSVSSDNSINSQNPGTIYRTGSMTLRNANYNNRNVISFMRFDISSLNGFDLSGATFSHTITWESSGGTYTLDVWGMTDETQDYWDSSTLTWTTASTTLGWITHNTAGGGIYKWYTPNAAVWQKLGAVTFTVSSGSPDLTVTTTTANCNFDSFLNADTNGLVTVALMMAQNNHWCNIASADQVVPVGTRPVTQAPTLTFPIGPSAPQPADGGTVLNYGTLNQLAWSNNQMPRYDVWFGPADANLLDYHSVLTKIATIDDPASSVVIPVGMLPLTAPRTYTWALDGYAYPASDPNHTGEPNQLWTTNLYQFETSALPTVNTNPADQYVWPTETASFAAVFEAIVPVTGATWYKNGTPVNTSDPDVAVTITNGTGNVYTVTLAISNVETADDAAYYCVAANSAGNSDPTASAYLVVKRMLAHWAFDGDAADETGVYNGTLMGTPGFVVDGTRNALQFDGVDDYVDLPDGFSNFRSGLTFAVWANPAAATDDSAFIDLGNGASSDNILFARVNTTSWLEFNVYNGASSGGVVSLGGGTLSQNAWQFFTATLDESGNAVLYKNGRPVATSTIALPNVLTRTSNLIGKSNWSTPALYNGLIDDIKVYNHALTEDQVAQMYADAVGDFCRYPPVNDFNDDCIVNLNDFAIVAAQWLNCGIHPDTACP